MAGVVVSAALASSLRAQVPDSSYKPPQRADTLPTRSFGGFVDTYYAWDFDRPHNFDRAFTTQPARHAEANVNLAFFEVKWTGPRYRGRLAVQWGTSVQANYASEPHIGGISGPSVSQFVQEASVGYQLTSAVWLDAGIFSSHLGQEGWISRDNLTYTRSLVADYSPYYEAGVRVTWATSTKLTSTLVVVNGWQDISNYNTPPAGGVRFDYAVTPSLTLSYDDFVGNAAPDSLPTKLRVYHDAFAQYNPSDRWQFVADYSLGTQGRSTPFGGTASWWGTSIIAKYHTAPTLAFAGRVERYSDPDQVIAVTGLPQSFRTMGASLGIDVSFRPPVLWRTEWRGFHSTDPVWPLHTAGHFGRNDAFIVSSLALTF